MKHFTIKELTKSETANRLGINNRPNKEETKRLETLVDRVLDPLREMYKKPIYVNSGFRCRALNAAVGGANNSQHIRGEAADITTRSIFGNRILFDLIRHTLDFDQLIWENNGEWIHVSYSNRMMILNAKDK